MENFSLFLGAAEGDMMTPMHHMQDEPQWGS